MNTLTIAGMEERYVPARLPEGASLRRSHEEWLAAESCAPQPDGYEICRAEPEEFPKLYELVDLVWGRKRDRRIYDWLYLHNPYGIARCTYMVERCTGEIVSSVASFPWPVAYGDYLLDGLMGGDSVTTPRLQRQGLSEIRRIYNSQHPFYDSVIGIGLPNSKSRALAEKYKRNVPFGPLPLATLPLNWPKYLRKHSVPRTVATIGGYCIEQAWRTWRGLRSGKSQGLRVESTVQFDTELDEFIFSNSRSDRYWCYHDSAFLNWRYLKHPLNEYVACSVFRGDEYCGLGVVRTDTETGMVMEFLTRPDDVSAAQPLLRSLVDIVIEAGCERLDVYATTPWRYWPLFKRAGFLWRSSEVYIGARLGERVDVTQEENWTLLPGDSDVT